MVYALPDGSECENCGAFVIDEAVVRLSRALGLDREKALKLFEQGFRHPTQLKDRDPDAVLEKGEVGLLFICTNCGGFVAAGDSRCSRCSAEFEPETEEIGPAEEDILDIVLCPICGADNDSDAPECEICGEPLKEVPVPRPSPEPAKAPDAVPMEDLLARVDDFLGHVEPTPPEAAPPPPPKPAVEPAPPPLKREVKSAAPQAAPVPAPLPLKPVPVPVPRPKPKPTIQPQPAVKPTPVTKPEPPTPAQVRVPDATPKPPATPALPTKQVRATLAIPRIRRAARSRRLDLRISPEIAGGAILVLQLFRDGIRGLPLLDGLPLLAGIALQLGGASLGGDPGATAIPVGLAVASAFPLAWSTKRLAVGRWRVVLAVAGAIPLAGLALAAASGPAAAGTLPWFIGIVSAVPWPAALTISEIRRRHATSILRRELVLAERDMARRNYERSLQEYDRAIAATRVGVPGAEIPWYGKGATLILLGRYEEALRAIDMALDINPRNEVAWVNKGFVLTKLGRFDEAASCADRALHLEAGRRAEPA